MSLTRFEKASVGLSLVSLFIATCAAVVAAFQANFASDSIETARRANLQNRQITACQDFLVNFEMFREEFERENTYVAKREMIFNLHNAHGEQPSTRVTAHGQGIDIDVIDLGELLQSSSNEGFVVGRLQEIYGGRLGESARKLIHSLNVLSIYSSNDQRLYLEDTKKTLFTLFSSAALQLALPPNSESSVAAGQKSPSELLLMMSDEIEETLDTCRSVMLGEKMELL